MTNLQMAKKHWQIEHHNLPNCDGLGQPRRVTVAIPHVESVNRRPVVYCTDGQVVEILAAELQRTLPDRDQPVLIGVHSHPDVRLAHERFFARDVVFPMGGAFAISAAFRNSDRFVAAIAFSVPPFGSISDLSPHDASPPLIYLAAGDQGPEKSIRKNMLKLRRTLQHRDISVEYCERGFGHTLEFWATEFVTAIHWFNQTTR